MSNYLVNTVDLSGNIFESLGQGTPLLYNSGYTLNGVDFRYLFLPYFRSKANATGYLYQNNDLCNIFERKIPFVIGSGITYIYGSSASTQYPLAVNPSHSLLYITGGTGNFQIIDSTSIVAMVLVGGGGKGTVPTPTTRYNGRGGEVITTTTFTNTTYTMTVGSGGTVNVGGDTIFGTTTAKGGGNQNAPGQSGNGILVPYNDLYYGGGGGIATNLDGFIGGGGGMGRDGTRLTTNSTNSPGAAGGRGYGQKLNVFGGSGGAAGGSGAGGDGGSDSNGGGGGGGGSGYVIKTGNITGSFFRGGNGGNNGSNGVNGTSYTITTTPVTQRAYSSGSGGAGSGGTNSGGGGGMPSRVPNSPSGFGYTAGGNGGSGIIIVVY